MQTLYFEKNDRLDTIISRIRETADPELVLSIPEGALVRQSLTNLKLIQRIASEIGKNVQLEKTTASPPKPLPSPPSEEPETHHKKATAPKTISSHRSSKQKIVILVMTLLSASFLLAFAFMILYLPKAKVTLLVEEKILEKEATFSVDPNSTEVDPAQRKIPGRELSVENEETRQFAATGTKTVGEKAQGIVILQNWTNEPLFLKRDTALTVEPDQEGSNSTFVLSEDANVPAQTLSVPSPGQKLYAAGQTKVQVEATQFGEEYNLAASTNFSVENFNFSELSALNETAFTGGSTREIVVISEEDQEQAKEQLTDQLSAQGQQGLTSKLLGDQKLLDSVVRGEVLGATFSHTVGDETNHFSLTLRTKTQATVYSESQVKKLISQLLQESVPSGFKLSSEELGFNTQTVTSDKNRILTFSGNMKALVIPDFNQDQLKEKLRAKSPRRATEILNEIPHLVGYRVTFWPPLPTFLQILPWRAEHLTIEVQTHE